MQEEASWRQKLGRDLTPEETAALEANTIAKHAAAEASEYMADQQERLAGLVRSTETAVERYRRELVDLDGLKVIADSPEEIRAINRAIDDTSDALREAQIEANAFASAVNDAVSQIEDNFQELFADIFENGLNGFEDFADGIADIFERLAAQLATQFVIGDILGLSDGLGIASGSASTAIGSVIEPSSIVAEIFGLGGGSSSGPSITNILGIGRHASSFGSALANGQLFNIAPAVQNFAFSSAGATLGLSAPLSAGQTLALSGPLAGSSPAALAANGLSAGGALTTAGNTAVLAASQLASLAVAPPLAFLGLGFMEALGNTSSGPAVGTNFDVADGRIGGFRVTTDNGGSSELGDALGGTIQAVVNAALDRSGGRLTGGAFGGEVGFANGRFGSSIITPGIASQDFRGYDSTGIFGITDDLRKNFGRRGTDEESMWGAIVDFVSRNFIDALDRGLIDGVSDEAAATMKIGFGNLARAAANGFSEADFEQAIADIDFIAGFDALAEGLRDVADTSATAADRLTLAAESQEVFNASLEAVRSGARTSAAESGSPLAGISDFVDQAVRVFDPQGPLSFQLRMLLEGNQDGTVSESLTRQIVSNGRFGFTTDPTVAIGAGPINGRGGRDINLEPNADQLFSILASNINDDAGFQRLGRNVTSGFQETLRGDPTTLFQQLGDFDLFGVNFIKNLDLSSVEEAVFDVFGPDGEFVTQFTNQFERAGDQLDYVSLTRDLVNTLIEAGAQVPDDLPIDPFFDDGRDRVAEALQIAKDQVEAYFAGVTETISEQIDGPLALFEEIVPAVSPLVTQFEEIKAQVEATVPDLEALNEDLAAFGQELINVGEITTDAITGARNATQDEFLAGLGIGVSSDGTLSGSTIDFGGIGALAETIKALDLNSASLFEVDERGLLPQVQGRIDELLVEGINALLGQAESYSDTLAQIENVFGDRIAGLLGIVGDQSSGPANDNTDLVEAEAAVLAYETQALIDAELELIDTRRAERDAIEETVDNLLSSVGSLRNASADLRMDRSLSTLSVADQLAEAERRFEDAFGLANDSDPTDDESLAAAAELGGLGREFLEVSRAYNASTDAYVEDFNRVTSALDATANAQETIANQQLNRLTEIRDLLGDWAEDNDTPTYVSAGNGQYVGTGTGGLPAGYDLGYNPSRAVEIYQALDAAGLPLPDGFGEGQLTALRQSNAGVDAVVRSIVGFADGGIMTSAGAVDLMRGGIANDAHLAVFGEGRTPEAFVPLPDGRRIPVDLRMATERRFDDLHRMPTYSQTGEPGLGNKELAAAVQKLTSEISGLRAENAALSSRLAKVSMTGAIEIRDAVTAGNHQRARMVGSTQLMQAAPKPRKVG